MLIEFRVANHRSLRDEQVLSMVAGRSGEEVDPRPRRVPGHSEKLLPVASLYGANASGKSNVLSAFAFMRIAVINSQRMWEPAEGISRDPFAWGPKQSEPSLFEVGFVRDGVRYQYGFEASDNHFIEEWLFAWPHGKKQIWFERDGNEFKFGEHLQGENQVIKKLTRPNSLFLSAAAQQSHIQLSKLYHWFVESSNTYAGGPLPDLALAPSRLRRSFRYFYVSELPSDRWLRHLIINDSANPIYAEFRSLLKKSDLGIEDFRVEEQDKAPRVEVKHGGGYAESWLPFEEESGGTQKLFRLAPPMLLTLKQGGVFVVDELESNLHPALAAQIIRMFNDPKTNPNNAQLIFTTHDTNLLGTTLGEPALRRDEVFLTEKDDQGATVLYPLTDFKPRKAENLESRLPSGTLWRDPIPRPARAL